MNIEWNKVTWYSKLLAVIVFVGTFALAFWLGGNYNPKIEIIEVVREVPAENKAVVKLSGWVTDYHTKESLEGVLVKLPELDIESRTSSDGKYSLSVPVQSYENNWEQVCDTEVLIVQKDGYNIRRFEHFGSGQYSFAEANNYTGVDFTLEQGNEIITSEEMHGLCYGQ